VADKICVKSQTVFASNLERQSISAEDVAVCDLWLAEAGRLQRDVGVLFGREGVPLPYVVAVWIAVIIELGVGIALILGGDPLDRDQSAGSPVVI
jgi:hypothetical protein